jgi:PAS domain S-box-containing protein
LANDAMRKFLNRDNSEIIGKSNFDFFTENEAINLSRNDSNVIKYEKDIISEDIVTDGFGIQHTLLTHKRLVKDITDKKYVLSISTDITVRKKLEDELLLATHKLEQLNSNLESRVENETRSRLEKEILISTVFETIETGIFITDSNGYFLDVNKALCKMTNFTEDELLGNNLSMIMFDANIKQILENCMNEDRVSSGEERIFKNKDNQLIYVYATHSKMQIDENKTLFLCSVMDITNQKMMMKKQKEQEDILIQQSKLAAMGEMIGAIAHQWRQPLTAVSSAVTNISIKSEFGVLDSKDLINILNDIETQTQRMSSTINDFMNFFRPNKTKKHFKIKKCIDDVYKLLSAQLEIRSIKLENMINNISLFGSKNELEQVLLNLVSNARDAFDNKISEEQKVIKVYSSIYDDKIDIIVEDNAGGIKNEIIDRIFEPYFSTKEEGKGSGIGLYMSKMIIKNSFGGDLWVENIYINTLKSGVRFIIALRKDNQ